MAPTITHLVIGERTFASSQRFAPAGYGAFLLGCVLADVNHFDDAVDRRETHFAGRLHEDGEAAFANSCTNFVRQLDALLLRPWGELAEQERAFVGGYLCHLAADEVWKQLTRDMMVSLRIASLADLPVPGEIVMTVFDVLSSRMYVDFPATLSALDGASVPDVLAHVGHDALQRMWHIVKPHAMNGKTVESYLEMLGRLGRTESEVQAARRDHQVHWEDAIALTQTLGGVEPYVQSAVQRSLEMLPRLWEQRS